MDLNPTVLNVLFLGIVSGIFIGMGLSRRLRRELDELRERAEKAEVQLMAFAVRPSDCLKTTLEMRSQ